ncbi:hypothetical protein CC85DRAFT_300412 [Cutaneotrichosporon oleaginosum]|uniref:Uncharacterized protein n=1 Tax=Cutaneotrichosporon oleaginosum TaxID=879819 RepID=A0A0J0XU44_9TREE|nr:uncharacterized protein CC85DRAFT_300412 [Cutaneotrichosporon oleaginosum]KLT44572.1 hypothetical protein CC85DRAFT_300412 [Cutaneotrichosporon oleaginosum]TXT13914.1 hypothetical protein COLE_00107 [Cutaneotrichosporon oleaginosum]
MLLAVFLFIAAAQAVRIHPRGATQWCLTSWSPNTNITLELCDQPVGAQDWTYASGRWSASWLSGEQVCMAPDNDVNTPPAPHPPSITNGAVIIGRECGSRPREAWTRYRPNTYQFHGIRMLTGHMCLDLPRGELRSGATIQVWKCSDFYNPNQIWVQGD